MQDKEQVKRIVVGATVAGVLLVFCLVVMIVYQYVRIGFLAREKAFLESEIERVEQNISDKQDKLEIYSSEGYLEYLARTYGYRFPGDK